MHRILVVSENAFLRHLVTLSLADLDAELRAVGGMDDMEGVCRAVGFDLVILLTATPFLCGRGHGAVDRQNERHTVRISSLATFPRSRARLTGKVMY